MSRLFYGSIDLTKLLEQAKEKHTAFVKAPSNGHIYANINVWLNDEPDEYDNMMGIKLSPTKAAIEKDPDTAKIYIGNCKESDNVSAPINSKDIAAIDGIASDLPY